MKQSSKNKRKHKHTKQLVHMHVYIPIHTYIRVRMYLVPKYSGCYSNEEEEEERMTRMECIFIHSANQTKHKKGIY